MESNKFSLEGKKILITGASSGIGKQTAIEASKLGAELVLTGRDEKRLNETLSLCEKGNHKLIIADLLVHEQLKNVVSEISKLDGIVHSAGAVEYMPCKFINEKNVYEMMDVNYKTAVLITSYLLRKKKLNNMASIVFISSIASVLPAFGGSLYSSAKAALEGFSRALSVEIAAKKMRSNCLLPTLVETDLLDKARKVVSAHGINQYETQLPLGFGEPEDVANTAIFLLSDEAKWITGQSIKMGVIAF
jgi:NAD(P)-dependent dehydrogenase (short-subunit alcohol dehydrogenase family)